MKHISPLKWHWRLALLFILTGPGAWAQTLAWQMAVGASAGSVGSSEVFATAADANGNVYITGAFMGTVIFGSATLVSSGGTDVFVAKWNQASGRFVWAQRAGGSANDVANAVAVAGSSVYVAGYFASSAVGFGSSFLVNADNSNTNDAFVAKLTDTGPSAGFVWGQRAGGTSTDFVRALAVSGSSIYVAGEFQSLNAAFGSTSLSGGGMFVAKITDAGTTGSFVWALPAGSLYNGIASSLAVSGPNLYLAGSYSASPVQFGTFSLGSAGLADVFVAKLTDAGSSAAFMWAQQAGGASYDYARAVAVSGTSVYITGIFNSTPATFGTTSLTNTAGSSLFLPDVFVAKLTDTGTAASFNWAKQAGGAGFDEANALAVSGSSVYVAGWFGSATAYFGSRVLTAVGGYDVFLTKLTDAGSTGNFIEAVQAGGTAGDYAYGLALSGGSVYVGGSVSPPATFGSVLLASGTTSRMAFLASLSDFTLTSTTTSLASANVAVFPNPAHATATIQLPLTPASSTATLTLLDALGRVVRTATVALPAAGLRYELNLTGLPVGLYALRVNTGDNTDTRRLTVE